VNYRINIYYIQPDFRCLCKIESTSATLVRLYRYLRKNEKCDGIVELMDVSFGPVISGFCVPSFMMAGHARRIPRSLYTAVEKHGAHYTNTAAGSEQKIVLAEFHVLLVYRTLESVTSIQKGQQTK